MFPLTLNAQIIHNGDFENSLNYWFRFSLGETPNLEIVDNGHIGQGCLVSNRQERWHGIGQNLLGRFQPGVDYHVKAWVKTRGIATADLALTMFQDDDRGNTPINVGEVTAVDHEWRLLEGGFRYQENGTVTSLLLGIIGVDNDPSCLLYTSPSPRDATLSRMPSSA